MQAVKCVDIAPGVFDHNVFFEMQLVAHNKGSRLLRAEREARSESTSIYRRKVSMSGRPAVVTLFERLFLWNGMTNSRTVILIRCHNPINHVFDGYLYAPVPATARGTCRGELSITPRRLARLRSNLVCV